MERAAGDGRGAQAQPRAAPALEGAVEDARLPLPREHAAGSTPFAQVAGAILRARR